MTWNETCPQCGSTDIELVANSEVSWGNDSQGTMNEVWGCNKCHWGYWNVDARVDVISRKLTEYD